MKTKNQKYCFLKNIYTVSHLCETSLFCYHLHELPHFHEVHYPRGPRTGCLRPQGTQAVLPSEGVLQSGVCAARRLSVSLKLFVILSVTLLIVNMKSEKSKQAAFSFYLSFYFQQITSLHKFFSCHTAQPLLHFKPLNLKYVFPPTLKTVHLYSSTTSTTVGLNIHCFYSVP